MPKSGGDRPACLTVADCGQIAGFGEVLGEEYVGWYLACAKAIHDRYPNTLFHICGMCDDETYLEILKKAEEAGYIKYHGQQKDMVPLFTMAHCRGTFPQSARRSRKVSHEKH